MSVIWSGEIGGWARYVEWARQLPALSEICVRVRRCWLARRRPAAALPKAYKSSLTMTCGYANLDVQARYDARNPQALKRLVATGALLRPFGRAVMGGCLKASNEVKLPRPTPTSRRSTIRRWLAGTTEISGGRSRNIPTKPS